MYSFSARLNVTSFQLQRSEPKRSQGGIVFPEASLAPGRPSFSSLMSYMFVSEFSSRFGGKPKFRCCFATLGRLRFLSLKLSLFFLVAPGPGSLRRSLDLCFSLSGNVECSADRSE